LRSRARVFSVATATRWRWRLGHGLRTTIAAKPLSDIAPTRRARAIAHQPPGLTPRRLDRSLHPAPAIPRPRSGAHEDATRLSELAKRPRHDMRPEAGAGPAMWIKGSKVTVSARRAGQGRRDRRRLHQCRDEAERRRGVRTSTMTRTERRVVQPPERLLPDRPFSVSPPEAVLTAAQPAPRVAGPEGRLSAPRRHLLGRCVQSQRHPSARSARGCCARRLRVMSRGTTTSSTAASIAVSGRAPTTRNSCRARLQGSVTALTGSGTSPAARGPAHRLFQPEQLRTATARAVDRLGSIAPHCRAEPGPCGPSSVLPRTHSPMPPRPGSPREASRPRDRASGPVPMSHLFGF